MAFTNPPTGLAASLPPIRACLFDMDGLLIDSEDLYTLCTNDVLRHFNKPDLPWSIKAQMQGRPGPEAGAIFHNWAQLPISREEFLSMQSGLQRKYFPSTKPLPGVPELLRNLDATLKKGGDSGRKRKCYSALATSSHRGNFKLKTDHLSQLFEVFEERHRVLGDDERIPKGRGKPMPDIYLLALETLNEGIRERNRRSEEKKSGAAAQVDEQEEAEIKPSECLVFEDSVPGVEAGRRAGMQVIWCPHPGLLKEYRGREKEVLAGLSGMDHQHAVEVSRSSDSDLPGKLGDGYARLLETLVDFPYQDYGIDVPAQTRI